MLALKPTSAGGQWSIPHGPSWEFPRSTRTTRNPLRLITLRDDRLSPAAQLFTAMVRMSTLQALVQGLLTSVISYIIYGFAVSILGASSGAAFAPPLARR